MNKIEIAKYIDYTRLKAETSEAEIIQLLDDAIKFKMKAVCVNPFWIKQAKDKLKDNSAIEIATVVGFPLGSNTTEIKTIEAGLAIKMGQLK